MIEKVFDIIPSFIHIIEILGILVVLHGAILGFYTYVKEVITKKSFDSKYKLCKAMAMGLEFKLAAEILKTVTVQSYEEIFMLAAIFILRIIMTFIIHFELKGQNEKHEKEEIKEKSAELKA